MSILNHITMRRIMDEIKGDSNSTLAQYAAIGILSLIESHPDWKSVSTDIHANNELTADEVKELREYANCVLRGVMEIIEDDFRSAA